LVRTKFKLVKNQQAERKSSGAVTVRKSWGLQKKKINVVVVSGCATRTFSKRGATI